MRAMVRAMMAARVGGLIRSGGVSCSIMAAAGLSKAISPPWPESAERQAGL
jgi:hypothetical protein